MKTTSPVEHIIRAALLTALCIPLSTALSIFVPGPASFSLLIGALAFLFVIAILRNSGLRSGKVTIAALAFIALSFGTTMFGIRGFCLLAILVIWSIRSVLTYSSLILSAADLMLSLASLSAAIWVWGTTGTFLFAVWTFFLLQGFSSWLPKSLPVFESRRTQEPEDRFQRAYSSAEEALKRVIRAGV